MVSNTECEHNIFLFTRKLHRAPLEQKLFLIILVTPVPPAYDKSVFKNIFDDIRELNSFFIPISFTLFHLL